MFNKVGVYEAQPASAPVGAQWCEGQHRLNELIHKINVGDVIEAPGLTAAQCREVAYASQSRLTLEGKRFVSIKGQKIQAIKRIA